MCVIFHVFFPGKISFVLLCGKLFSSTTLCCKMPLCFEIGHRNRLVKRTFLSRLNRAKLICLVLKWHQIIDLCVGFADRRMFPLFFIVFLLGSFGRSLNGSESDWILNEIINDAFLGCLNQRAWAALRDLHSQRLSLPLLRILFTTGKKFSFLIFFASPK